MKLLLIISTLLLLPLVASRPADPVTVTVTVIDARTDDGQVMVALFADGDGFPRDFSKAAHTASAPLEGGTATVQLADIPAGIYAIAAFHDADGNGEMKTNFVGMPREGVGVVNWTGGRPRFDRVVTEVSAEAASFDILLNYR